MALGNEHRSRWSWSLGLWVGYWVLLFIITHRPMPAGFALPVSWADKAAHMAAYFILAMLGGWHQRRADRRPTAGLLITWGCIYAAYAALDEWLQPFVGRTLSLSDWLADVAGIAAAMLVLTLRGRSSSLSEPEGRPG